MPVRHAIDEGSISTDEEFISRPSAIGEDGKFRVVCISCDKRLRIRVTHAGRTIPCPKCKSPVNVPVVLPDGTITSVGASASLDVPLPPKPRQPQHLVLYVTVDVVLFFVLGMLIGYAIWH